MQSAFAYMIYDKAELSSIVQILIRLTNSSY